MEITVVDFISQLVAYPALIITTLFDFGGHPRQRMDRCAECDRHLHFHPRHAKRFRRFNGGIVQFDWRHRHDIDKSKGGRDHLQYGRFSRGRSRCVNRPLRGDGGDSRLGHGGVGIRDSHQ